MFGLIKFVLCVGEGWRSVVTGRILKGQKAAGQRDATPRSWRKNDDGWTLRLRRPARCNLQTSEAEWVANIDI